MKHFQTLIIFFCLVLNTGLAQNETFKFHDLNINPEGNSYLKSGKSITYNNKLYFSASDGFQNRVWAYDVIARRAL